MKPSTDLAGELIMRCFNLRTVAHIAHLQTKSYAQHEALNDLYTDIIPATDAFAEVYQGDYGIITKYGAKPPASTDALTAINELTDWITTNRHELCDPAATHIQNIVDEIVAILSRARYKLRNLS